MRNGDSYVLRTLQQNRDFSKCSKFSPASRNNSMQNEQGYEATQVVGSLMDVGLDIVVCLQFYEKNGMSLFWISLAIFIVAQIAYVLAFMRVYCGERNSNAVKGIKGFLSRPPSSSLCSYGWRVLILKESM